MADGVTGVITALIGAAGNVAPGIAAAVQQREAERRAKRDERNAALQASLPVQHQGQVLNPTVIPSGQKPWPTWVKVAALGAGVVVIGGVGYAIYRSVSSGGSGRRRRR